MACELVSRPGLHVIDSENKTNVPLHKRNAVHSRTHMNVCMRTGFIAYRCEGNSIVMELTTTKYCISEFIEFSWNLRANIPEIFQSFLIQY